MNCKRGHAARLRCLAVAGFLAVSASYAADEASLNDEGPFVGGVFSRPTGEAVQIAAEPKEEFESPLLFDKDGNSNDVIVLPALEGTGKRQHIEDSIVEAVNAKDPGASDFFGEPVEARHLIHQGRLDAEARALLDPDDPQVRLQRYLILRYRSVEKALAAVEHLRGRKEVLSVAVDTRMPFQWAPNDPYFPIYPPSSARYQWGMHAMNFPAAWDRTKGNGYVGAVDGGLVNPQQPPSDLSANYRPQFYFDSSIISDNTPHGTHVLGIIGATANNGIGVTGGCPSCSVAMALWNGKVAESASQINSFVQRGMQVVNMSFGKPGKSCSDADMSAVCTAIAFADQRDLLLVAAAGNELGNALKTSPNFPASHASVLSVGGAQNDNASTPTQWSRWVYGYDSDYKMDIGSAYPGINGVMAPARSIVSTMVLNSNFIHTPSIKCGDTAGADDSGTYGDQYGTCTGTSMAAPHVSALAGILRSVNSRLSRDTIKNLIRSSSSHYLYPSDILGVGLPNARTAVDQAIAQTPNKLAPLFSMYSPGRLDYFYTTVPQMGSAASWGTLAPVNSPSTSSRYSPSGGNYLVGYNSFPGGYPYSTPVAAVWVFSTPENPKNASIPLVPLYRLSWKCGDYSTYPPTICASNSNHMDVTYTADTAGVSAYQSVGYKLDGIEGYIYPKTMTQPTGTVRLMRKYNPARDDHAIFPESMLSSMAAQGYTQNSGSDWLGYVYPNSNGTVPPIQ